MIVLSVLSVLSVPRGTNPFRRVNVPRGTMKSDLKNVLRGTISGQTLPTTH